MRGSACQPCRRTAASRRHWSDGWRYWLLAATAAVTLPAAAYTTATAELRDFRWTLTDLDPLDGIDPSISFGDNVAMLVAAGVAPWLPNHAALGGAGWGEGGPPHRNVFGQPESDVTVGLTANGSGGHDFLAAGWAAAEGGFFQADVRSPGGCCFTLSPQTRVQFTATAVVEATRGGADDAAQAFAGITLVGPGVTTGAADAMAQLRTPDFAAGALRSFAQEVLQLDYLNGSSEPLWGGLHARVLAVGRNLSSAVPQPPPALLWLAGGLALGWVWRRRPVAGCVPPLTG